MKLIGKNHITGRQIYLISLPALEPLIAIESQSKYFGAFLACNATGVPDKVISEFAHSLLKAGLVCICTWGSDCERVIDLFDAAIVENDPDETDQSVRMTTWLPKKTVKKALWHFFNVLFPADDYRDQCQTELLIIIGNDQLANAIHKNPVVVKQLS